MSEQLSLTWIRMWPFLTRHKSTKFCKKAYQRLTEKNASIPLRSQGKWLADDFIGNVTVSWDSTYALAFGCTKETKPREFQFKLPHRRIATNDFLLKIGIKQSDSCTFCEEATENLVHLFRSCKYSKAFWKDCYQWIMQNISKVEKFNLSYSAELTIRKIYYCTIYCLSLALYLHL